MGCDVEGAVFVGVDVGAERLHVVALQGRRIAGAWVLGAQERERLREIAAQASVVAVDAPAELSTLAHRHDAGLSPKFQVARCAEIALGRQHRMWVPWVAPSERPASGWIATGLAVHETLRDADVPTIEVYPYAGFRALGAGGRLPPKTSRAGRERRVELLGAAGIAEPLAARSHHELDALVAAVIARDNHAGRAVRVTCGHDPSALWLPRPPAG